MIRTGVIAGVLLLSVGCLPDVFFSEAKQLLLEPTGVTAGGVEDVTPGRSPVLVGTTFCASVCLFDAAEGSCGADGAALADACFAQSASGPASLGDDCITFEAPGDVRWSFEPRDCAGPEGLVADGVDFVAIAARDVTAARAFYLERFVADAVASSPTADGATWWTTAEGGGVPDDVLPAPGDPMLFMAGGVVSVGAFLVGGEAPVIWGMDRGYVSLTTREGASPALLDGAGSDATYAVAGPGAGNLDFRFGSDTWALGVWEAVEPEAAASLDIVVAYVEFEGQRLPAGARAVIRDAAGRPIFGAPVEWGVAEGPLGVILGAEGAGDGSYAFFDASECMLPSARMGAKEARLQARFGGLTDEIEVEWLLVELGYTEAELAQLDAEWQPGSTCVGPLLPPLPPLPPAAGGCGCATGAGPSGALGAWLGVLVIGRFARRSSPILG